MENEKSKAWKLLLAKINSKDVIPVIGQGLYSIETEGKGEILLYDYLTRQVARAGGITLQPDVSQKFAKACFEYLKTRDYQDLTDLLKQALQGKRMSYDNPLLKLARIKAFNIFINTTYDHFLVKEIKKVRNHPCTSLIYSKTDNKRILYGGNLADQLETFKGTLVYNIYGSLDNTKNIAFTERDILERLVELQEAMSSGGDNWLFQELSDNSLLFMGCGYDDWLFRFFVRTISNQPYEITRKRENIKFINDVFQEDPSHELPDFLRHYDAEIFHTGSGKDFVDKLFNEIQEQFPGGIIKESEFPRTAFISYNSKNTGAARNLATQLKADGINVWFDEDVLKGGDNIDQVISNAIDQTPVFVPLISKEAREAFPGKEQQLRYYSMEWVWAHFSSVISRDAGKTIIPVIIDDTQWMHEQFKGIKALKIPNGKGGEYEALKKRLLEIQMLEH
jgi:hypothetical protein